MKLSIVAAASDESEKTCYVIVAVRRSIYVQHSSRR
jgi:hypothetical protein